MRNFFVACILMHDGITHGTLFNPFEHSQFRATSCTLQFMISLVACILMHDGTTHCTLFTPFGHSQFRATSCTLRFMISLVACILMHDGINHGTKQSAVIFACIFSDNVLSTVKSVIHFVQLVARMIQPRYAIH